MPKSIEEIKSKLAELEDGQEYLEGFNDAIQERKSVVSKRNKEAQSLRERLVKTEERLSSVSELIGHDPDDEEDSFEEKLEAFKAKKPGEPGKPGEVAPEVQAQIDKLARDLKKERELREKAEKTSKESNEKSIKEKANSDLIAAFDKKAISPKHAAKLLMADHFEIGPDGKGFYKIGEEIFDNENDVIGPWLEANVDLKANPQHPGGGTNNNGGKGGGTHNNTLSMEQAAQLPMEEYVKQRDNIGV